MKGAIRKMVGQVEKKVVTLLEAGELLGVSKTRMWELTKVTGEIETIKIGKSRRVLVESINAFIESKRERKDSND